MFLFGWHLRDNLKWKLKQSGNKVETKQQKNRFPCNGNNEQAFFRGYLKMGNFFKFF